MEHRIFVRTAGTLIGLLAIAVFLQACKDNTAPVEPDIEENGERAFRFQNLRSDTTVDERATIVLRWTTDTTIHPDKGIIIYAKDPRNPYWHRHLFFVRSTVECEIPLVDFTQDRLRFGIGLVGGPIEDSTGIIDRTISELTVIEPQSPTPFLRNEPNVLRWHCSPPSPDRNIIIYCARHGSSGGSWEHVATVPSVQDSIVIEKLPIDENIWVALRFRLEHSNQDIIIDSIPQVLFNIKNVGKGDIIERGTTFTVDLDAQTPTSGKDARVLSLSTDGGTNWTDIEEEWVVTEQASEHCYLRLSSEQYDVARIAGPFTIADNTTTFFQPEVGMKLRYRSIFTRGPSSMQTSDTSWLTIDVERMETFNDRTVYHCLRTTEKDGKTTTGTGTLTQRHDGLREITGSFIPYREFPIPGILHPDIEIYKKKATYGTPGEPGVNTRYFQVERGRGIILYYDNTFTGHFPPSGYGTRYVLM